MDPSVIKDMASRSSELKCLRCDGELEEGYLPSGQYGFPLSWREGGFPRFFDFLGPSRKKYRVKSYLCVDCGRLELFANPEN